MEMNNPHGTSLKEFFNDAFDNAEEMFREMTRLSEQEREEYSKLLEKLKESRKSRSNNEKGRALEELVSYLIRKSSVFSIERNIHTSSNEIDQLIVLNSCGSFFHKNGWLNIPGNHFLGECKNYDKKIAATWVGKLYSLAVVTSSRLAILFSYQGLSGKGWNDAVGLTKKIFLCRERIEDRVYLIQFSINDFEEIGKGRSFLELLFAKMTALKTDTNCARFISPHPAEDDIGK